MGLGYRVWATAILLMGLGYLVWVILGSGYWPLGLGDWDFIYGFGLLSLSSWVRVIGLGLLGFGLRGSY